MSTDNIELVHSLYAAFARGDIDTIRRSLADDVVVEQTAALPWGGSHHGVEGFTTFLATLLTHIDTSLEVGELFDAGGHVVEIGRSRGRVRATGVEFDAREVQVWAVRAGRVVSFHPYIDTSAMLHALAGQRESAHERFRIGHGAG